MARHPVLEATDIAAPSAAKALRPQELPLHLTTEASDQELLDAVIAYYHQALLNSPDALTYLERLGIADVKLIETHRLGFANRTLGLRLPIGQVKAGAAIRKRLQNIGVLRESGHEHFNGCLVAPTMDDVGHVCAVYGRRMLRGAGRQDLYLPPMHQYLWNSCGMAGHAEVIVTQSLLDCLAFWSAGFHNVTTVLGATIQGAEFAKALRERAVNRVLICFTGDEAGRQASERLGEQLMAAGIECYRIPLPTGSSANLFARSFAPANKSLGRLIRKAVWLGKGEPVNPRSGEDPQPVPAISSTVDQIGSAAPPERLAPPPKVADAPATAPDSVPTPSAAAAATGPESGAPDAAKVNDDEVIMLFDQRRWRIRGLAKNLGYAALKVNLLVNRGDAYHVDNIDLYAARARTFFVSQAAKELGVNEDIVKGDLGRVLLKLESVQDARIRSALRVEPEIPRMSDTQAKEAMALLEDPQLIERIVHDFDACGLIGETTNKVIGYLAATSRKLERPLAIVVQSSSAAGKTALMDAVLAFVPEEERTKLSTMTGQSLYYMGQGNLQHKVLAIAEEEGASRVSYALKLLQSEGELTIASTGKDPGTGRMLTQQHRVQGPVMLFLTTTAIEIDEELLNRCMVLSVDEGREQTEAIHRQQRVRRTLGGMQAAGQRAALIRLHQNAQRLLRPLAVINPFAEQLTFLSDTTRARRDHEKYLTLIDTIALLHQYQRPVKSSTGDQAFLYVEVTATDIEKANALAHEALGRSLDELPPQTRRLLGAIARYVRGQMDQHKITMSDVHFSRRDVRAVTGWGDTQLRVHLDRLVSLEYLLARRHGSGGRITYELLFDGDASAAVHMSGLIDATVIGDMGTMQNLRGAEPQVAGRLRGVRGSKTVGLRGAKSAANQELARLNGQFEVDAGEKEVPAQPSELSSYTYPKASAEVHAEASS